MMQVIKPLPFVFTSITVEVDPSALHFILEPFALIQFAIFELQSAHPMSHIIHQKAMVLAYARQKNSLGNC